MQVSQEELIKKAKEYRDKGEPLHMSQIVSCDIKQKIVFVCVKEEYLPAIQRYVREYFDSTIIIRAPESAKWIEVMIVCCIFDNHEVASAAYDMFVRYISRHETTDHLLMNIHTIPIRYTGKNKYTVISMASQIKGRRREYHEVLQSLADTNPDYIPGIPSDCLYLKELKIYDDMRKLLKK